MSDAFKRLNGIANAVAETKFANNNGDPQGQYPTADYWRGSSLPSDDHQLNFAGDQFNADDRILNGLSPEDQQDVVINFENEDDSEFKFGTFDLVLNNLG